MIVVPSPVMSSGSMVQSSGSFNQQPCNSAEQEYNTLKRRRVNDGEEDGAYESEFDNEMEIEDSLETMAIQDTKRSKEDAQFSCRITVTKDKSQPVSKHHHCFTPF